MTRSLDWVFGLLISNANFIVLVIIFFSQGFLKSIYLGGRGKRGGTMKVEKSVKITKQRKGENGITKIYNSDEKENMK